ncbi:hypothetical protein FV242_33805 [Methylobacterium sp. WL64]|uniref:hypothetical protein n=1 Tax=Methylobacterium sp. WL64 TaxID=2603894 RepID=UPI0011C7CBE2|nr:hypothetical protein [Methylobacterium sp. WL64]TXM96292.1 hypothetical protein FV242_33805 [Methylobacterium sp. WL64]
MARSKNDDPNFEQASPNRIATGDGAPRSDQTSEDGTEENPTYRRASKLNLYAGLSHADQAALGVQATVKRGLDPACRLTIEFEVTSKRQAWFLDMAEGQEAVVHVTCLGTEGEWQRLKVRKAL